jgi:nucleoside-diphosphate-sugar epimerase
VEKINQIACVTGASGIVGRKIVERLLLEGYTVRVLSRKDYFVDPRAHLFSGGLDDEEILKSFLLDADLLFHCAAELNDEEIMWDVNFVGTERLIRFARKSSIKYLCYLSSAGVVGRSKKKWVDEETECNPQNIYERSKLVAEQLVAKGIEDCKIVILRPTNIVDEKIPEPLFYAMSKSFLSRIKVFFKGGECAHLVYVWDVVDAAMFFISKPFDSPQCYIVSCDWEPLNTFAGLSALQDAVERRRLFDKVNPVKHLPLIVTHIFRKLFFNTIYRSDVSYSSEKLMRQGFKFRIGIKKAAINIFSKFLGKSTTFPNLCQVQKKPSDLTTVAIIGASGFIGKNLLRLLSSRDDLQIRVLEHRRRISEAFLKKPNVTAVNGDILSGKTLECLFEKGCTVVNLAHLKSQSERDNIVAAEVLAATCAKVGIKRLIHCSSVATYGNVSYNDIIEETPCYPKIGYGIIKLKIENLLIERSNSDFELVILRPTSVFGPEGESLIKLTNNLRCANRFINYLKSCLFGTRNMNLVYIDNVISALIFLMETSLQIEKDVFVISDDDSPMNNFWGVEKHLIKCLNYDGYLFPRIHFPSWTLKIALILARRSVTQFKRVYHTRKLMEAGFLKTTSFEDGLTAFAKWYEREFLSSS